MGTLGVCGWGAWGGPGSRHSRDTQGGKGAATTTFLFSQENYKQMWAPQGGVEQGAGAARGALSTESQPATRAGAQGAQPLPGSGARADPSEVLTHFPPTG